MKSWPTRLVEPVTRAAQSTGRPGLRSVADEDRVQVLPTAGPRPPKRPPGPFALLLLNTTTGSVRLAPVRWLTVVARGKS